MTAKYGLRLRFDAPAGGDGCLLASMNVGRSE